jgi:hypothetical protein
MSNIYYQMTQYHHFTKRGGFGGPHASWGIRPVSVSDYVWDNKERRGKKGSFGWMEVSTTAMMIIAAWSRRSQFQSWFRTPSATIPDFVPVTEVCFEKRFFPP